MSQAQCPNCGGYKVRTSDFMLKSDGSRMKTPNERYFQWGHEEAKRRQYIVIGFGGAILFILFVMLLGSLNAGLMILLLPAIMFAYYYNYFKALEGSVRGYDYSCNLCGYQWTQLDGQPAPDVTVRPDLIEQGALKLEEEEKRQREAAMAAHHVREQQKRKNK